MRRIQHLTTMVLVSTGLALAGTTPIRADHRIRVDVKSDQTWMEFVGQVVNPTTSTSNQFGYLTYLRGVENLFNGPDQNEHTARFTFFNETSAVSVLNHGPLRIITREGVTTIYLQTSGADFADPDSFRAGTPVQTSRLRHVVVLNTTNNSFTTLFENLVTSVSPVEVDGHVIRLGRVGQAFKTTVLGQIVNPVPPNGWIAGFAVGVAEPSELR